jgi:hypothetical protein
MTMRLPKSMLVSMLVLLAGIAGSQSVGQRFQAGHIGAGKAYAGYCVKQRTRPKPMGKQPE